MFDRYRLSQLPLKDLCKLKWINFCVFQFVIALDLSVFYRAMQHQNWLLLLVSFGVFVTGLALYDNYLLTKEMHNQRSRKQ